MQVKSIDEKWLKEKPWLSIRNISIFIIGIMIIGLFSFLSGNLDLPGYVAVNIGIVIAWLVIIPHTIYSNWSYITYIDFSDKDILKLIKIGEKGDNKVFFYKFKKDRIEMVFGIGEGFDYFFKDSKLKISNKSKETKKILDEYIDLMEIKTFKQPIDTRIEIERIKKEVEKWKINETDKIRNLMLEDWTKGSLAWLINIIVFGMFLVPFLITSAILIPIFWNNILTVLLISFIISILFWIIGCFFLISSLSMRGDIHTPRYYSFFKEGMIIKLGRKGKVVLIDQDHILEMKVYSLPRWIYLKYSPPSQEYQTKINFIIKYQNKDKSKFMKIKGKYFKGEYDT